MFRWAITSPFSRWRVSGSFGQGSGSDRLPSQTTLRESFRMSNQNPPTEPSPALTAAELRRRLLASTPPPTGVPVNTPGPQAVEATDVLEEAVPTNGSHTDLLSRLRMPGRSGPVPVPTPRPMPAPSLPEPTPTRPPQYMRRMPSSNSAINGALNNLASFGDGRDQADEGSSGEIRRVRTENKELRKLLEEMKQLLQEASESEQQWVAKQKDFDEATAAKDKQIEELSVQLGTIEEQIAKGDLAAPPPVPKTRTELEEWGDDLEKENAKLQQERKKLDEERRQLREDEEALESQMRDMEVSMARERALIARQETELRRLSAEIQHELELMQRGDASLREQMSKFQRRAQEVLVKPTGGSNNGRR